MSGCMELKHPTVLIPERLKVGDVKGHLLFLLSDRH